MRKSRDVGVEINQSTKDGRLEIIITGLPSDAKFAPLALISLRGAITQYFGQIEVLRGMRFDEMADEATRSLEADFTIHRQPGDLLC
jgi:hypothetical protein